jgi:hypothetical protein
MNIFLKSPNGNALMLTHADLIRDARSAVKGKGKFIANQSYVEFNESTGRARIVAAYKLPSGWCDQITVAI